jgi:hypothetical protein
MFLISYCLGTMCATSQLCISFHHKYYKHLNILCISKQKRATAEGGGVQQQGEGRRAATSKGKRCAAARPSGGASIGEQRTAAEEQRGRGGGELGELNREGALQAAAGEKDKARGSIIFSHPFATLDRRCGLPPRLKWQKYRQFGTDVAKM